MNGADEGGRPGEVLAGGGGLGVVTITGGGRVELRYQPTAADFRVALRARIKAVGRYRLLWWVWVLVGVVWGRPAFDLDSAAGTVYPLRLVPPLIFLFAMLVVVPFVQAREFRAIAAHRGPRHIVVDDSGVSLASRLDSAHLTWAAMSRYVETRHLFVLLSSDKNASAITLLPRYDSGGRDVSAQLRDTLDRHLPGRAALGGAAARRLAGSGA